MTTSLACSSPSRWPSNLSKSALPNSTLGLRCEKRGTSEMSHSAEWAGAAAVAAEKAKLTLRVLLPSSDCIVPLPAATMPRAARSLHCCCATHSQRFDTFSLWSQHGGMHTTAVHRLSFVLRRGPRTRWCRPPRNAIFGAPPPSSACRADDRVQPAATQVA